MIQDAREARGISKRAAAQKVDMSESWWRKMELGWHKIKGEVRTMRPSAEALAQAALIVGLSPARVLKVGGYRENPVVERDPLREEVHAMVDAFSDDQLPMIKSFLEGLRAGLDHSGR